MRSILRLLASLLFVAVVTSIGNPAMSDELPMFGMKVRKTTLGVQIDEIEGGRPISTKLQSGDILKSFVQLTGDAKGQKQTIDDIESLRKIREILFQGDMVEIFFLRPVHVGSNEYQHRTVTLEAQHLSERIVMVEEIKGMSLPSIQTTQAWSQPENQQCSTNR